MVAVVPGRRSVDGVVEDLLAVWIVHDGGEEERKRGGKGYDKKVLSVGAVEKQGEKASGVRGGFIVAGGTVLSAV